jgi:hypothetical protein
MLIMMNLSTLFNKLIILPVLLFLVAGTAAGQAKTQDLPFFFIQLTDPPLGNAPSGLRIVKIYNDRIAHNY